MKKKKVSTTVVINNRSGLHARPASVFAKEANKYKSDIKIISNKNKKEANAKSIIDILSLTATRGQSLELVAEGEDAEEAVKNIQSLVEKGLKNENL